MLKPDILMLGPIPIIASALEAHFEVHRLWEAADKADFIAGCKDKIRGIVTFGGTRTDAALIDSLPKLEIIGNFGVGYDTVDARYAATKGLVVTNTPDVLTEEVADTALGLILMTVREFGAAERHVRDGKWLKGPYPLSRGTLRGKRVGIVGYGRIGKAIATRLKAFGVSISYHNRRPAADADVHYVDTLVGLARQVDVLVSVLPGGAATRHIFNAEVFAALGPEGIFINVGRGSVVDEAALVAALKAGRLYSAGLDVYETEPCLPSELAAFGRVVLLPHVGSASQHTRGAMGQLVVDNLVNWFVRGAPLTPVTETPWPR
ncbi:MAG: 2-hydroxyacid dehydrogenase [Ancalomicrobiaceae bacterium]|nr:2-hydroxyacid dehydrogenase [Ancalomicrobiaceae bacterium]